MSELDYTVIPRALKECMKDADEPLTDMQFMLVAGFLGGVQMEIEKQGLENVIHNIERGNKS